MLPGGPICLGTMTAPIAENRRARFDYHLEEFFEAGVVLTGWEIKAIRAGQVQLTDGYVMIKDGELFLIGCRINALRSASTHVKPEADRTKKLLMHKEEIKRLKKEVPDFSPGDTVIVNVNVVEGERKRSQAFEGMVIAKRNRGLNSSFIVRKISSGEGVERTFQTYSPLIASVEVKRKGEVRRSKLYYLRQRSGKSARIREKVGGAAGEEGGEE